MKDKNAVHVAGKRKRAVARATIKKGSGKIKINRIPIDGYEPSIARMKIREALFFAPELLNKVDITVQVSGGGISSQAEAVRLAIARSIAEYTKDGKLEKNYFSYDRHFLVADVRRKEMRKPNSCGKARAKKQKSYR